MLRSALASTSFRLALVQGLLMVTVTAVVSVMFYFGTVGVLTRGIETKYVGISDRLVGIYASAGRDGVEAEIRRLLEDGIDSDTEVYLLADAQGRFLAGNLSSWPGAVSQDQFSDAKVVRVGRRSVSLLFPRRLDNGDLLIVGRDMEDLRQIASLVWKTIAAGATATMLLAFLGATIVRRQVETRLAAIRHTSRTIMAGDMKSRIPASAHRDEFSRLSRDINLMLDRIQQLMDGTMRVSDAIAHDLRTPLTRIRGRLDEVLRMAPDAESLREAAADAIFAIDELMGVFEKLLTIAEAEAGVHRRSMAPVPLGPLVGEVAELYDAMAEETGTSLDTRVDGAPIAVGDKDLLAVAMQNLVDNALKYAGDGAHVRIGASEEGGLVSLTVADDGPGIPEAECANVRRRFYRLDAARSRPGNGLGLSLVEAIASLHGGALRLENAHPGLRARVELPRAAGDSFQPVT